MASSLLSHAGAGAAALRGARHYYLLPSLLFYSSSLPPVGWACAAGENAGFRCRASLPLPLMGAGPFGIAAHCNATSAAAAVSEAAGVSALLQTETVVSGYRPSGYTPTSGTPM